MNPYVEQTTEGDEFAIQGLTSNMVDLLNDAICIYHNHARQSDNFITNQQLIQLKKALDNAKLQPDQNRDMSAMLRQRNIIETPIHFSFQRLRVGRRKMRPMPRRWSRVDGDNLYRITINSER